jgi:outer membrane receptor protein involved in Fe transport
MNRLPARSKINRFTAFSNAMFTAYKPGRTFNIGLRARF